LKLLNKSAKSTDPLPNRGTHTQTIIALVLITRCLIRADRSITRVSCREGNTRGSAVSISIAVQGHPMLRTAAMATNNSRTNSQTNN
jgi:hypothetical protein